MFSENGAESLSPLKCAVADVLSFTQQDDCTVVVKREKICDGCGEAKKTAGKESDGVTLLEFLDGLSADEQRAALIHLSVKWAEQKGSIC